MSTRWSDAQINMIGAQASNFPTHNVVHWNELHSISERVRALVHATNEAMAQVEEDKNLSTTGMSSKRAEVAREALDQLARVMEPAQGAVARRITALNVKAQATFGPEKSDPYIAAEIRAHIAKSESPAMAAHKHMHNKQVVAAILAAPSFLSGLSEQEAQALRARLADSTDQGKEIAEINKAVSACHGAVRSAAAMIGQRAQLQRRQDGTWE